MVAVTLMLVPWWGVVAGELVAGGIGCRWCSGRIPIALAAFHKMIAPVMLG